MIPFLTYPLAMTALVAIPALTAIYLLRNRFRRRQVSSLMLWRFRIQSNEGGARVHRLRLPLLFFLELFALLLLVTAATGPHWKLPQSTRPLIVVLDDSFSMRAASEGSSAQLRAREVLAKLYRFQPPPSTRLLLAGAEPRLLGAPARNWAEVEKMLDGWTCWAPAAAIESAITLASEIGRQQANILVLTDHAPADEKLSGDRLQWRATGLPLDNIAIVNASRTANGEDDRCLLEIANFSSRPNRTLLTVGSSSNLLSLDAGERQRLVFNLPGSSPMLEAAIDRDALPEDNHIQLLPPVRKKVRVQVALTNAALTSLVERTLAATGLRAALSDNPELIIHHSNGSPGNNAWSLNWVIPEKASAYTGPFIIDGTHPLAEGLALQGAIWAAGAATNSPSSVPVVLAGNVPLLSAADDVLGRQFLTLNLDPELSTVQTSPDWPILFWNILDWRTRQMPGLHERNARLGSEVMLRTTGEPLRVVWPDGTVKSFPQTADQVALETPLPGLYTVVMGTSTNSFAVNVIAGEESDLSACSTGKWGGWQNNGEQKFEQAPMAWIFALAALGILTLHLCLLGIGKGGR